MSNPASSPRPIFRTLPLRTIFFLGAFILVASVVAAYLSGYAVIRATEAIASEQQVIDQLQVTLSTAKDAETGQRGYIITGEDKYLDPYNTAKANIPQLLQKIDILAASKELAPDDVDRFKSLVSRKFDELDYSIDVRKKQGFAPAHDIVVSDVGRQTMDQLRAQTAKMVDAELAQLHENESWTVWLTAVRTYIFILLTIANLVFLHWAYRKIRDVLAQRQKATNQLLDQKELLRVTLASIGDGVIVTDSSGTITFLNPVAENLTGWSSAESEKLPVTKIFNIINEASRKPVESPVEKVLREGIVVGLANHTLLIRKDGSELPIDDSGAPIRDTAGDIRGAVLIFRDFSEYKKHENELLHAKQEAEAANIAKDNFIATLSHELRTPLTPVAAILSSWELGEKLPPQFLADVQLMRRNVDLEARLIDDLLDLTRIVRGKLSLSPEVADVHVLLSSVASMYQSEIHTKRLRLYMHLDAPLHFVFADPARLQQVFLNLLKNAIKFTPEGGTINLLTKNADTAGAEALSVQVQDTGIGMNPATIEKLFLPFEQGTDETVKRYGGLGLGLAIARALMDAQGGNISAQSPGPGQGSTFDVRLPVITTPNPTTTIQTPAPTHTAKSVRILFVEDHADTARVMSNLLTSFGHHVTLAQSVASALQTFDPASFDLLLSDIGLPDGTGIDLIKSIRLKSDLPAVALTGYGMEDDVTECTTAGFTAHLTKPINFQKLEMLIQQLAR